VNTPQQSAAFHLSYDSGEDRILVAIDVESERRYAMALTRRLAKLVLAALADFAGKHSASSARTDPQHRDTVLNFEHSSAVAAALASGDTKTHQPGKPLVEPPRLIREVKLTPKEGGAILVTLYDGQRTLTLELDQPRIHSFMAGVLELAAGAGWDLPLIAAWLDRAGAGDQSAQPRVVH
jgi:hypothetical protein